MNRNKVLELAKEAELARQLSMEVPFVVDRLERFAALIEAEVREVRGDAEPVAWMFLSPNKVVKKVDTTPHGGKWRPLYTHPAPAVTEEAVAFIGTDGNLGWLKNPDVLYSKPVPLFTHPTPAVVRQLVDALKTLVGWEEAEAEHFDAEGPDDWIMEKARAAIAKATGGSDDRP